MNLDYLIVILKFGGAMLGVMAIICGVTVLTPHLAKFIDKRLDKKKDDPNPERVDEDEPTVKGPYDKQVDEDFDPNYKIYNTDIYGFNKKNNKK